jgi:hypothetical protein
MEKYKMYVSVVNQQVYLQPHDSPWEYEIEVPNEYIPIFHRLFTQMDRLEFRNFLRAHLPYVPYHYDKDNYDIDRRTMKVYALIHEFTDDESKQFIETLPYFR